MTPSAHSPTPTPCRGQPPVCSLYLWVWFGVCVCVAFLDFTSKRSRVVLLSLCLTITWHDALEVLLCCPRGKALLFLWPRDVPHAHATSSLSVPVVTDTWSFPCLGCCEYCCSERRGHVSLPARVCISWRRVPRIGIAGSRGSPAFNF